MSTRDGGAIMSNERSATRMFAELTKLGYIIQPAQEMDMRALPGALQSVPSITTYGTPDIPVNTGAHSHAELEQRPAGDSFKPNNT
jgi:hypothetical protein